MLVTVTVNETKLPLKQQQQHAMVLGTGFVQPFQSFLLRKNVNSFMLGEQKKGSKIIIKGEVSCNSL